MERLKVRFEQIRGHWLVVEGEPALSREDCDDFRLRMLQSCEVAGLLKPETEEIDGKLSLRYSLAGSRMLSQTMRAEKWSIADLLTALCRMAEVLEDCRLYVLDEGKIVLDDDRIFVGEGCDDLRFLYLPLREGLDLPSQGIRDLVVRWIMYVAEPDGQTIQRLLRLSASPGFRPADLRTFARQALSERMGAGRSAASAWFAAIGAEEKVMPAAEFQAPQPAQAADFQAFRSAEFPPSPAPSASSPGWRWFQPPSPEAQALSGLLGEESSYDAPEVGGGENPAKTADGRFKIWLICGAAGVAAMSWRWGYAAAPGRNGLLLSAALTLAAVAGAAAAWFALVRKRRTGGRPGARRMPQDAPSEAAGRLEDLPIEAGRNGKPGDSPFAIARSHEPKDSRSQIARSRAPEDSHSQIERSREPEDSRGPIKRSRKSEDSHGEIERSRKPEEWPSHEGDPFEGGGRVPERWRMDGFPFPASAPVEDAGAELESGTPIRAEERTQLLTGEQGTPPAAVYALEWESRPDCPILPLNVPSFVIGRSREASAHVDDTAGVSRAHVELLRSEEGWTAKDLGSRNGTKLNGAPMAPYETYSLHPEDRLELAGSRYRVKLVTPPDTRF